MSDNELAQIVKNILSHQENFDVLYSHIAKQVFYWCYTIVGNTADAEDAMQEAMIKIYRNLSKANDLEKIHAWLYRVVTNSCYDFLRKRKRQDVTILDDDSVMGISKIEEERRDNSPTEMYNVNETKELIASFVNNLPRKQREAIILFYLEEFKATEIAMILDCSLDSVKARLHKGRKNLEKQALDYQEKNNRKLYPLSIFLLLKPSLLENRDRLYSMQKISMHFQPSVSDKLFSLFTGFTTFKILVIGLLATIILGASIVIATEKTKDNDAATILHSYKDGYQYLYEVSYNQNLTRNSVPITITLLKDITETDITITYKKQTLPFTLKEKEITMEAIKNGTYTIQVKDEVMEVVITNIDKQSPVLMGVYSYPKYLQLQIDDPYHQINYEESYALYQGTKYSIINNQIKGTFNNLISIVLYNDKGQYITYELKLR